MKKILLVIFILLVFAIGAFFIVGYTMAKRSIEASPFEAKIQEIQIKPNYVYLSSLPKYYQNAVIAVEDHRFKKHSGYDIIAIGRAIVTNIKNFKIVEGGSTITQQLIKNLYFSQDKNFLRKITEFFVAIEFEKKYSKETILELYVNSIYFGDGYYGIKEAANGYFNKEPSDITFSEATILAGIPNAPSVYSLTANKDLALQRQQIVFNCMIKYDLLPEEEKNKLLNF